LFIIGWVYLYKPNLVLHLNRIAREFLFNDRLILVKRKRLAVLFFCFSFIALFMGVNSLTTLQENEEANSWVLEIGNYKMYLAMQDFCAGKYQDALDRYQQVLHSDPQNIKVLKRIAFTYTALGDKRKASLYWRKVLELDPADTDSTSELKKLAPPEQSGNNKKYIR